MKISTTKTKTTKKRSRYQDWSRELQVYLNPPPPRRRLGEVKVQDDITEARRGEGFDPSLEPPFFLSRQISERSGRETAEHSRLHKNEPLLNRSAPARAAKTAPATKYFSASATAGPICNTVQGQREREGERERKRESSRMKNKEQRRQKQASLAAVFFWPLLFFVLHRTILSMSTAGCS